MECCCGRLKEWMKTKELSPKREQFLKITENAGCAQKPFSRSLRVRKD